MNTPREDNIWNSLLAQSAPTFAGACAPPLGLAARVLAGARETRLQEAAWERVGLRALFASLAAVGIMAVVTFARVQPDDGESPVQSLIQVGNLQVS